MRFIFFEGKFNLNLSFDLLYLFFAPGPFCAIPLWLYLKSKKTADSSPIIDCLTFCFLSVLVGSVLVALAGGSLKTPFIVIYYFGFALLTFAVAGVLFSFFASNLGWLRLGFALVFGCGSAILGSALYQRPYYGVDAGPIESTWRIRNCDGGMTNEGPCPKEAELQKLGLTCGPEIIHDGSCYRRLLTMARTRRECMGIHEIFVGSGRDKIFPIDTARDKEVYDKYAKGPYDSCIHRTL